MSPSSALDANNPQMNGTSGAGPPAEQREQEVETGAVSSGLDQPSRSEPPQTQETGGGCEKDGGDADVDVGPRPSTETSAGHTRAQAVPLVSGEDPFLFQGSRPRVDIVSQASSSGGGPAGQRREESGEAMQSIYEETATMGGFHTPRRSSRTSLFPEAIRPPPQGGIHGLVAKIGEFFKAPAVAWLPSPIPSPPIPRGAISSQPSGSAEVFSKPGPGTAAGNARSAIGGDRRSVNNPNSLTPSSSEIPTEAIQAEVQRQLGGLLDRLQQMENENHQLQRQLQQATAEKESQQAA